MGLLPLLLQNVIVTIIGRFEKSAIMVGSARLVDPPVLGSVAHV
jgi:hypothetical protein